MKKVRLIITCLIMSFILCGCKSVDVDNYADISNKDNNLNTGVNPLTAGEAYDYIRENDNDEISDELLKLLLDSKIDFENGDMLNLYKEYLNEEFYDLFIKDGKYHLNGEFNEQLLVSDLYRQNYDINCGEGYTAGNLDKKYFACDYSDYIEKNLKKDIYLDLLKIQYLIDEKEDLIDKKEVREITYYSVKKSSSAGHETLTELVEVLGSIKDNYNSTDGEKIKSLEDYEDKKIKEDIEKLDEDYAKLSSASDSSFTFLDRFTRCGDLYCSDWESYNYQYNELLEKKYLETKVVTKDDEDILYAGARELLFSSNINDYLINIGGNNFLVSPVSGVDGEKVIQDAVLFDTSSSTYYLVIVNEIDSSSRYSEQIKAAKRLLSYISDSIVLDYYFGESNIYIYDSGIREYFTSIYGDYKKD